MKIAVITPCYNAEKYVHDCLSSVSKSVNFGEFEYEHIVVDDGSTDGSWKIVEKFESPNLRKFRFEKNKGQSVARNFAVSKTSADYLFFLDADDVLFQNSLRTLMGVVVENNLDWLYFDFLRGDEKLSYLVGQDYYGWDFKSSGEILKAMFQGKHFFQGNIFLKRSLFDKVGGYRKELTMAEDLDLCTRLLLRSLFPKYWPGYFYIHRFHQSNLSSFHRTNPDLHKADVEECYLRYKNKLKSLGIVL